MKKSKGTQIKDFEWLDDELAVGYVIIDRKRWKVTITDDYEKDT